MCNIFTDVHGVIFSSNRTFFAVGENLVLQCNTTPPDLVVSWEEFNDTTNGFVNDPRSTFSPVGINTFATLANLTLSDTGVYGCFPADTQLARLGQQADGIVVLPG